MSFELKPCFCLFCFKELDDGIEIEKDPHTKEIIIKYFWFDLLHSTKTYVCSDCWLKIKTFHDFYRTVETLHNKQPELMEEEMIELDEMFKSSQEVVALDMKVLECQSHLDDDINLDDGKKDSTSACQAEKSHGNAINLRFKSTNRTESHDNTTNTCLKTNVNSNQKSDEKQKKKRGRPKLLRTVKSSEFVTKQKRGRPKLPERHIEQIVCYMCNKSFKSTAILRRHFLYHDPELSQQFSCQMCDRKFPKEYLLRTHIVYVHENGNSKLYEKLSQKTTCPICEKSLTLGSLRGHISVLHNNKARKKERFVCEICAKVFTNSSGFTQHTWTHMNEELTKIQCDICEKWLKNRNILRVHKQSHEKTPLKCIHCGKIKFNVRALRSHIAISHAIRKHQCTFCEKSFTRAITLKEHMAVHTGQSLYKCPYCSKTFKSNANKYKHMREVHTEQWNIDRVKK